MQGRPCICQCGVSEARVSLWKTGVSLSLREGIRCSVCTRHREHISASQNAQSAATLPCQPRTQSRPPLEEMSLACPFLGHQKEPRTPHAPEVVPSPVLSLTFLGKCNFRTPREAFSLCRTLGGWTAPSQEGFSLSAVNAVLLELDRARPVPVPLVVQGMGSAVFWDQACSWSHEGSGSVPALLV